MVLVFQKMCLKVKVLKMFKISVVVTWKHVNLSGGVQTMFLLFLQSWTKRLWKIHEIKQNKFFDELFYTRKESKFGFWLLGDIKPTCNEKILKIRRLL